MFEPYRKADYTIYARHAFPREKIYNYLEDSEYITDCDEQSYEEYYGELYQE